MDERANTRVVQQVYRSLETGDMQAMFDALAADVEWVVPAMPQVPFAGTWRGRDQVGEFFRRMAEAQDVVEFAPVQFIAQDDVVVVLGRFTMHVKATARESRSEWAHVWTVKDGKVVRMIEYVDIAAVIRAQAAGPSANQQSSG